MLKWEEVHEQVDELIEQYSIKSANKSLTIKFDGRLEDVYQICLLKGYDCWSQYKDLPIEESRQRVKQTLAIALDMYR
ncbi:hypothetical protein [Brevibacillus reuszeri]|uniref:hypothetical protein n=1 Tax=Brevibacillus reuszeri TaxID=54915 RepID=UPI0028998ACB|nr:hypothetical protein [Brevibacillus reuszeri]